MDMAAMRPPVENQIGEIRQSHGKRLRQTGLWVGQPDPEPGLASLLDDGGEAIVVDDGLELCGSDHRNPPLFPPQD